MIRDEGEKIVALIGGYKAVNKAYPDNLEQLEVMIRYYPRYSKKDNQRYILVYNIFGFLRLSYDPLSNKWYKID